MKQSTFTFYVATILVAFLVASCSHRGTATPTGNWTTKDGVQTEFHADGSFVITNLPHDKMLRGITEFHGTWKMVDSTQIDMVTFAPNGGSNSTIYGMSVSGDKMTISQPGGNGVKTFQRIKDCERCVPLRLVSQLKCDK
jgi:hypothetical protein